MYIERFLEKTLTRSIARYPVVGLVGCRQVGKTTLARMLQKSLNRESIYLDLELPSDLAKLENAELYLRHYQDTLIIIDEIQREPGLFPVMRALIDEDRRPGRFMILGSASPDMMRHASESLAGRIIYHELAPFSFMEAGVANTTKLWVRGGLPESFLAPDDEYSFEWREAFIRTYLERDIPQLGIRIPAARLRRFWTMVAHVHGNLWNASHIANAIGVSSPSVKSYLDVLEDTFIARQLQPFHANIKKRLIKSPKVYIRDPGLLHVLLGIRDYDALLSNPAAGHSYEGFAIEEICKILPETTQKYFFRTSAGAEIDLLLFDRNNRAVSIEIKFSLSPRPGRGFFNCMEYLESHQGYVIYPGDEMYPITDNVMALPLKKIDVLAEIVS